MPYVFLFYTLSLRFFRELLNILYWNNNKQICLTVMLLQLIVSKELYNQIQKLQGFFARIMNTLYVF